jgi:hypothetical protein
MNRRGFFKTSALALGGLAIRARASSASENLTHCWSHGGGTRCPRCGPRPAAEVIAEVNGLFQRGIQKAEHGQRLLVWDWGWADAWVEEIIRWLPPEVTLMSVSEWAVPIRRGGVTTTVGEYSLSTVGPGPRATRHWALARQRGLRTVAKIQANNTWELSAVPYVPVLANVAQHAANLCASGIDGLMLSWTLGGYPSPNLEVVAETMRAHQAGQPLDPVRVLERVATRRFGPTLAPAVVQAWRAFSAAFSEFPYHGAVVYNAPMQYGPSNLLWEKPTTYRSTMVGFPYDDLDGWRAFYPPEVFATQFAKMADGFDTARRALETATRAEEPRLTRKARQAVAEELTIAEAAAIHLRSTGHQARFVLARQALASAASADAAAAARQELERLLNDERALARRLHALQTRDSRLGFEASNHYFYVPVDLAEKVLNCEDLLRRWQPRQMSNVEI